MQKPHLFLAAFMAAAPAALLATPPLGYGDFILSDRAAAEVMRAANERCPKRSDDAGSTMAKEPQYQSRCRYKQTVQSEARLKAAFKRAMPRLSKEAQNTLRAEQRLWIKTRFDDCERDRNDNLGGAQKNMLFYNCQLIELKRRTLWIERPS